jgi:serine/threonine protein kinase
MNLEKLCVGCMQDDSGAPVCPACGRPFESPAQNPLQMRPRTMLHDQYLVGRALGHGGFGVTYLAWDTGLATRLAVKEYLPHGVAGRAANTTQVMAYSDSTKAEFEFGLERFLEEARTLKRFKNFPGIVSIDTVFRDNGTAYLVMEYLDGCTFEDFLKQRGGHVPFQTALEIMLPVMRALAAVHGEGILHRDISPDNIYVTSSGVKLIDFGAARNALGQKSRNLSIILKEGFAPEEQYRSSGTQGPWTDVYATAGTLYFALTGRIPQGALDRQVDDKLEPPSRLGSDIDPRSEAALMRALSIRAHDRFQSMQDFSAALTGMAYEEPVQQQYAQTMQQQAPPPYQPYEFMPPAAPVAPPSSGGGNKGLWIAIGVVAALMIGYLVMKPAPVPVPGPTGTSGATGATGTTGGSGRGQASNPPAGDYKGILQQAAALDQKHSYQDELALLDKAIQLDPNRFEAYDLKAQVYLYNFKQWPEAKDNFEKSLAHGGNATFHVVHDHSGGIFSVKCSGWLYVTRDGVEYKASDQSQHKFKVRRGEITDVGSSKPFGSSPDHHAFHMRINKVLWNLAPQGEFGDEQRSMILGLIGG